MPDVLIYGDTERFPALRHEIPVAIGDPFLYAETGERRVVLTNVLEVERIRRAAPGVETLMADAFGVHELVDSGMGREEALLAVMLRVVEHVGVTEAHVPPEFPLFLADALRGAGVGLTVDAELFEGRRRVKNPAELEGIVRAQRAAEAGLKAGEELIRSAGIEGDGLVLDGTPLTADMVRARIREVCAEHGASCPADILVATAWSGGGHDPGTGPLPAQLPIEIDMWPQDEQTGCWADMTRTFVAGGVTDEIAALAVVARDSIEAARALAKPGALCRDLYDAACQVIEDAGFPTMRTRKDGETLTTGFYFGLGHGIGLDVHEAPGLGRSREHTLIAGDVIAIEPGLEGLPGIGGVRFEDLLLITESGSETLTDYPYEL